MARWANYLVSAVQRTTDGDIARVVVHIDEGDTVGTGKIYDATVVISLIEKGSTFCTIVWNYNTGGWNRGALIDTVERNGWIYLRTIRDKTRRDNLGNLPPISYEA